MFGKGRYGALFVCGAWRMGNTGWPRWGLFRMKLQNWSGDQSKNVLSAAPVLGFGIRRNSLAP